MAKINIKRTLIFQPNDWIIFGGMYMKNKSKYIVRLTLPKVFKYKDK